MPQLFRNHARRTLIVAALFSSLLASAQTPPPATTLPSESPATLTPTGYGFNYDRREVMIPMRDGVKLHTVILVPKGAKNAPILLTRTPYSANALTTNSQQLAPRLQPLRLRQRNRRHRRRRLHPRHPGRPRQVRLRRRLRHEPPPPRPPQPNHRRPRHRHLRHHRLARKKYAGEQRQGRHHRHLLRRIHHPDGPRPSAPRAQSRRPDEPDGRRLDAETTGSTTEPSASRTWPTSTSRTAPATTP